MEPSSDQTAPRTTDILKRQFDQYEQNKPGQNQYQYS